MLKRTNSLGAGVALVMLAVACSSSVDVDGGSESGTTASSSGTGGSSSASGTTGGVTGSASGTGGATGSSSSGTGGTGGGGGGGAGPAASRAKWSTIEHLICDGGAGPVGNLDDIHIVIDKLPFVCEGACEFEFTEPDSLDCSVDWRLHMRVPPAPGVYDLTQPDHMGGWLKAGPDPENPSRCQHHPLASGTVEITSVGPVEVTGVVSGVSALSAPDVDPNGPFTAPRCD